MPPIRGLPAGSRTVLLGPPGTDKTVKAADRLLSESAVRRFVAGDLSSALFGRLPRESLRPLEEWTAAWTFYDGIAGIDIFTDAPPELAAVVHLAEHRVGVQAILRFGWDGDHSSLRIEKLEGFKHPLAWIPVTITPKGIEI